MKNRFPLFIAALAMLAGLAWLLGRAPSNKPYHVPESATERAAREAGRVIRNATEAAEAGASAAAGSGSQAMKVRPRRRPSELDSAGRSRSAPEGAAPASEEDGDQAEDPTPIAE